MVQTMVQTNKFDAQLIYALYLDQNEIGDLILEVAILIHKMSIPYKKNIILCKTFLILVIKTSGEVLNF